MPFFERLVDRFYDGMEGDPVLLSSYPDPSDLTGARRRLTLFLVQYWEGPRPTFGSAATRGCGRAIRRSPSVSGSGTAGCSI